MAADPGSLSRHLIIALILFAESLCDLRWRECPDAFHLLMASLVFICPVQPFSADMLLEALPPGGIFLAAALTNPGKLGGADVKLAACAGLLFGWREALAGLSAGLVLALAQERKRPLNEGFPLIPYLTAGLSFINIGRILI